MKHLRLIALGAFVGVALLLWWQHQAIRASSDRIAAREVSIKRLTAERDSLARALRPQVETYVRWRVQFDTLRKFDTLRLTDTVRVTVRELVTRDSTVRSCGVAIATCELLRVKSDSLVDSLRRDVADWKRIARGPLLRPSAELLFLGRTPRLAGVLEAGPRRLSAVARLEVDSLPRFAAGVRYEF